MNINGTLINYYFHCKRQCYLFANRINLEDNSEDVRVGRIIHQIESEDKKNAEIKYSNMSVDKITENYIVEIKKSDADVKATRMQLLFYMKNLEEKGIKKEGKIIYKEKNKVEKNEKVILNEETKKELEKCEKEIEELLKLRNPPQPTKSKKCNKCAYYEYCYI